MTARAVYLRGSTDDPPSALRRPPGPCAAFVTEPASGTRGGPGVLILPPIGYESSSSHRLWRTLAERLADSGATVVRLDYWATGDSAGSASQVRDPDAWRASVTLGADWLRAQGRGDLVIVACQLGAALVSLDAAELDPTGIVAVAPVQSGRRFVRGLSVLGLPVDGSGDGIAVAGHHFRRDLLEDLSAQEFPLPADVPVLTVTGPAVAAVLQRPAEEAEVAPELVTRIADWIGTCPVATGARGPTSPVEDVERITLDADGTGVHERFVTVGASGLFGVLTTPDAPGSMLYVLVNSGSDPHTGPGRAWVELARHLAARGHSTLRVDLRGWGESPDGPSVPGRPYDQHGIGDLLDVVDGVGAFGFDEVVLGGLCAGAWIALAAARTTAVTGTVVLNPQLYWWPGDPVEALMSTTRARRTEEIRQIRADAVAGRWDAEDVAGLRPPAGLLLDDLADAGRSTVMVFAAGDDGIEYLRDRLGRRLAEHCASGAVRVIEVPDVDHGLHRTWLRTAVYDVIGDELSAMAGGPGGGR